MKNVFSKASLLLAMSCLVTGAAEAYCARCVRIESERAKEQASHPEPPHYYDEAISAEPTHAPSNHPEAKQTPPAQQPHHPSQDTSNF